MAGQRQPLNVIQGKGRKHLTKAEIENRQKTEVKAKSDNVQPPKFLGAKQKKRFTEIANELLDLDIMANIDCEALGRLIVVEDEFIAINKAMKKTPLMVKRRISLETRDEYGNPIMKEIEENVRSFSFNSRTYEARRELVAAGARIQRVSARRGGFRSDGIEPMPVGSCEGRGTAERK